MMRKSGRERQLRPRSLQTADFIIRWELKWQEKCQGSSEHCEECKESADCTATPPRGRTIRRAGGGATPGDDVAAEGGAHCRQANEGVECGHLAWNDAQEGGGWVGGGHVGACVRHWIGMLFKRKCCVAQPSRCRTAMHSHHLGQACDGQPSGHNSADRKAGYQGHCRGLRAWRVSGWIAACVTVQSSIEKCLQVNRSAETLTRLGN